MNFRIIGSGLFLPSEPIRKQERGCASGLAMAFAEH